MFPILMVQIGTATKMQKLVLAVVLVCLALGLRASSFQWNDQLQGDVNLFALTAREFRHSGELRYPIKYEFSDQVPYCEAISEQLRSHAREALNAINRFPVAEAEDLRSQSGGLNPATERLV